MRSVEFLPGPTAKAGITRRRHASSSAYASRGRDRRDDCRIWNSLPRPWPEDAGGQAYDARIVPGTRAETWMAVHVTLHQNVEARSGPRLP